MTYLAIGIIIYLYLAGFVVTRVFILAATAISRECPLEDLTQQENVGAYVTAVIWPFAALAFAIHL